jgi:multiple sugar transport system substrate-binding protein
MKLLTKLSLVGILIIFSFLIIFYIRYPRFTDFTKDELVSKVYYADNISNAHQILINKFNEEYKGKIEVVPVDLPFSKFSTNERKELLTRSLRSNSDRLDLFAVDYIWVPRFAKWVEPLDLYFSKKVRQGILKKAIESCVYEEKLVAIPLYIDIGLMYYRKDILKNHKNYFEKKNQLENSLSWSDFIKLRKELPEMNNYYYMFPAKNYEGLVCSFVELLINQNSDFFNKDSISFDNKEGRTALKLLVDAVNSLKISPMDITGFDEFQCFQYALNNDIPFVRGWPAQLKHYKYLIKDTSKFELFDIAAVPHLDGHNIGSVLGGWNLMIPRNSDKKWESFQFIYFLLREENQRILAEKGGYIPIISKLFEDEDFLSKNEEYYYYQKLIEKGIHRPFLDDYTKISDVISYYTNQAIKKEISIDDALNEMTRQVNSKRVLIK